MCLLCVELALWDIQILSIFVQLAVDLVTNSIFEPSCILCGEQTCVL
jgi:hypothetical protein